MPIQNSISFINELNKHNVSFESHIFQHGQHGLSLGKYHTSSDDSNMISDTLAQWFQMAVAWLKKTLCDVEICKFSVDEKCSLVFATKFKKYWLIIKEEIF